MADNRERIIVKRRTNDFYNSITKEQINEMTQLIKSGKVEDMVKYDQKYQIVKVDIVVPRIDRSGVVVENRKQIEVDLSSEKNAEKEPMIQKGDQAVKENIPEK